jgi:hypothetical protein
MCGVGPAREGDPGSSLIDHFVFFFFPWSYKSEKGEKGKKEKGEGR